MSRIGEIYAHVSNSGLNVAVDDDGKGPALKIQTSAFGNLQSELMVLTDKQTLRAIGEMLIKASEAEFSAEYPIKATSQQRETNKDSGNGSSRDALQS